MQLFAEFFGIKYIFVEGRGGLVRMSWIYIYIYKYVSVSREELLAKSSRISIDSVSFESYVHVLSDFYPSTLCSKFARPGRNNPLSISLLRTVLAIAPIAIDNGFHTERSTLSSVWKFSCFASSSSGLLWCQALLSIK